MRHSIQSRVNGLIIAVPSNARGVLSRYSTAGDNEMTFVTGRRPSIQTEDKPMVVESETTPKKEAAPEKKAAPKKKKEAPEKAKEDTQGLA